MTSFAQDRGVDHRHADVFGEDNQRLSFTVLQCQASFTWRNARKLFFFEKDNNTKIKMQVFYGFSGKERGRIFPGYPRIDNN
ncbi:MAG: hypothetical protein DYG83_13985 [Candidatus Brocadia sp. AMX2]|uniref:Uncharacterized protein n=1 Tax=Candidatus Brocadia sinica JPN1 TaxID=1197129 RepID=A0ABQ0JZV4_9BACT|nr:MAG: hypothetical protein EDM70_13640 [Candidatus Brocadia sp. AMX2]MBC6933507.1 hypothetical protein [Candidatus Brocadia sp.]MBL1170356.1 hypothetical protein [Candidatus Brocadia sp. AMX1]GAN34299.1 hypothetical protein BROSI_A2835 [Candidatus Brocadia sinica JPN1]GIK11349.1 MAG: hypothetical protein BroJett002_00560 [Candidatus Brocadia sinica]